MTCNEGSSSSKELFCYFHVGGKFICNEEGRAKYVGGNVKLKNIKDGIILPDLKLLISTWLGIDCNMCEMKYTVSFDERTLIELNDDGEVRNLFDYNDTIGHIYIGTKENDNGSDISQVVENSLGLSQQRSIVCSSIVENENEALPVQRTSVGLRANHGEGCNRSLCIIESAPTPMPELNCRKWKELFLGVRQIFSHVGAFKDALYKYSIAHKFDFDYVKNCKEHMSVKCKIEGCPWKITANAVGQKTPLLRVTTFVDEHHHSAQDNLQVCHGTKSSVICSIIIDDVRNHIDKPIHEIRNMLLTEYGISLTYKQAYRAKEKAKEDIEGRPEDSYMLIPWICKRLKESDHKTIAEWEADSHNVFERAFIAYGCCIEGFLAGARHALYIDGTHLSGPYNGTLLSASGYDADDELLPFAIAIVERETLEDWSWFLYKIKQIVGSTELTIVSDRHVSIRGAVEAVFGGDRHAYCYRHVKENFSAELLKVNSGKRKTTASWKEDAKQLLDNIAYARLDRDFNKAMEHMRKSSKEMYEWLIHHGDINKWALSKFAFRRWDKITTNLAESFNAWVKKERKHNVSLLIHEHREKVAKKMYAASMAISKWKNGVGPNINSKLKENVDIAEHMSPQNYGGGRICVHTKYGALSVDLGLHSCSCKAWDMSGIPCPHACAAIKHVHGNVYDYVEECYKVTSQEKIYNRCMNPVVTIDVPDVNNFMMKNFESLPLLLPPRTRRPSGRPPTKRRESQTQNNKVYHCSRCKEVGHTRRKCKNPNPN